MPHGTTPPGTNHECLLRHLPPHPTQNYNLPDTGALPDALAKIHLQHKVCSTFHLDVRSGKTLYDGMDIDALRKVHLEELRDEYGVMDQVTLREGEEPAIAAPVEKFVILVADGEVLAGGDGGIPRPRLNKTQVPMDQVSVDSPTTKSSLQSRRTT
ncbi:hypothetical protein B0T18DRAFT_490307 [Schizothecium vesticola]|uniref:Uncharacterized protein n=1 Tax=Schizothecium vesticola TaxID=314040 RepID=A0AA40K2L7_9PEZI|nr:hypothetical protein B0T18DRAFT_490307 [Schizothecium vesticola]